VKRQILDILRETEGFVSGEELSRQLGVTRAAVWKVIKSLRQEGYRIEAVTNRGYHLAPESNDVLNRDEILGMLKHYNLQTYFNLAVFTPTTGSTNQLARQGADQGLPDKSLFITERQTAGRGRRGKSWLSDSQDGLWLSILLRPQSEAAALTQITLFTGLCLAEALNSLSVSCEIKWPNDVLSRQNGRKLAGILTEMIVEESQVSALIIGTGINVNTETFDPEISETATSLSLESGRRFSRLEVLAAFLQAFARRYPSFADNRWLSDYRQLCLTLGRQVLVLQADGNNWTGVATGLDEAGELIVVDQDGQSKTVRSGEVSVRGLPGYS